MPRSERLELRVTAAEKMTWDALAVQDGLSLSEYIRARVNAGVTAPAERPAVSTTRIAAPTERTSAPRPP